MAIPTPDKSTTGHTLRPLVIPWPVRAKFQFLSAVSPAAAARYAKRLFFAPPLALRRKPEAIPLPGGGEPFELESRGKPLRGTRWGAGPSVMLVHGWAGQRGQMAPMVAPLTAAGFQVIAADMPGHGQSGGQLSSVIHFSDALLALGAHFGPLHAVVAHSFGAASTTYAFARGLTAERAVFFAPPSRFESFWSRFQSGLGMSDAVRLRLTAEAEAWLGVTLEEVTPWMLAPRIKIPLLVLHDAGDREVAFEEGAELVNRWPGARLTRTEHLGHLRILRDPASIAAMAEFVGDHSTATRKNLSELSSSTSSRRPSLATNC